MIQFLGSNFEAMKEPPVGVQELMESWLSQMAHLPEPQLGYRLIERAKGRPQMARIHLQGVRNDRFVNARVKPDNGGNENCWIVSVPVPREFATDDFFEDLQIAANRVNGWTEAQLEERQMLSLHALLRGQPIDLVRVKEAAAIEAGFPSLNWLGSALVHLSANGQFVRNAGGNVYEWDKEFDTAARKQWRAPSEPPPTPEDPIVAFIRAMNADGLAATELLGELPSIEEDAGRPRIRIPNDFPLPEEERESFYLRAEGIRLLNAVGNNPVGVQERVWELDLAVYEEVLGTMDELGLISHQLEETPPEPENDELLLPTALVTESAVTQAEEEELPVAAPAPEPPKPSVSWIREELSAAKAVRASSAAERAELQKQYEETVLNITETARSVAEMQRQVKEQNIKLNDLHRLRASLKLRVRTAGKQYHDSCVEAKKLGRQLQLLEAETTEQTATSVADLLKEESRRTGVPIERLLATLRTKLRGP